MALLTVMDYIDKSAGREDSKGVGIIQASGVRGTVRDLGSGTRSIST